MVYQGREEKSWSVSELTFQVAEVKVDNYVFNKKVRYRDVSCLECLENIHGRR